MEMVLIESSEEHRINKFLSPTEIYPRAGTRSCGKRLRTFTAGALFVGMLAGCSSSNSDASPVENRGPLHIGVNVNTIAFWDGSRPFRNLIYGSGWSMQGTGGSEEVPVARLDANGWIKSLPRGHRAQRVLSMPPTSADIVCRWDGNDHRTMSLSANLVTSRFRRAGTNEIRFHYRSTYPKLASLPALKFTVNPSNYVRNIDCREASAPPTEVFDPTFLRSLKGFRVIRFVKWQMATEANTPVTWQTRNKPGDGSYWTKDGVPVEQMVELANGVGADPWFTMPWNADDDYVTRFAVHVRDNLARGRRAYVEVSNEVWNGSYPVMRQAEQEGIAEGLDATRGPYGQAMYRYAEKTQHVMQLWSKVFSGRTDRLVRVVSAQNVSPFWSEQILGYRGTAEHVDALATAPYWALGDEDDKGQSLDQIMDTVLPARIEETLNWAAKQKAIAKKYGKRYIAYEGGQHVWLNKNADLVAQIERDPRMAKLYSSYIRRWNNKIGDTLTLFCLTGDISTAGFGLVEYAGQPTAQAPKMRAVRSFLE